MTESFQAERDRFVRDLEDARAELDALVRAMEPSQLGDARRGGWTVRRVLQHVVKSERHYSRLAAQLSEVAAPDLGEEIGNDVGPAVIAMELGRSRRALLAAVEGADEKAFYRLQRLGHEEYSLASLLENVAGHEREHLAQIQGIVRRSE